MPNPTAILQRIQMCLATGIGPAKCDASGAGLALATAHRAKVTVVLLPLYLQAHVAVALICDRLAHLLVLRISLGATTTRNGSVRKYEMQVDQDAEKNVVDAGAHRSARPLRESAQEIISRDDEECANFI